MPRISQEFGSNSQFAGRTGKKEMSNLALNMELAKHGPWDKHPRFSTE